jgi:serine protease SohB
MIMEFVSSYGLFLLKAITIVIAILVSVMGIAGITMRNRLSGGRDEQLNITNLNDTYTELHAVLEDALLSPEQLKAQAKLKKKEDKAESKAEKRKAKAKLNAKPAKDEKPPKDKEHKKRLYVLDFDGDIKASAVEELRQEITATLTMATERDEVLVRVESGGGEVHSYGLAASQLQRLRDHKIPLTVSVDKVAASGGYLMACVADKIVAAPFAILGSIGVIAQIPNIHKILKKNDVEIEQLTAGEYKRTLTLIGENTDKAREKMQEELEEVHDLFKDFVITRRPQLNLSEVATGEHWLGSRALDLKLVDELITSDDYIMAQRETADILALSIRRRKSLIERVTSGGATLFNRAQAQATEKQYPKLM